jgi:hypothetical protein
MSVFPVVFTPADTEIVKEDTTNLSFFFEPINGFSFFERQLPFMNTQCIQLFLQGKFIQPSFTFTRNRRTQSYMLETLYLSPLCPTVSTKKLTTPTRNSFVMKGSMTENNKTQNIFMYIPFERQTLEAGTQVNTFDEMNKVIMNARLNDNTKVAGTTIDLNSMIPKTPYHYHELLSGGESNIIIFFESSSILLDPSLIALIPPNIKYNDNITNKTFTIYESVNPPDMKRITLGMEDNIYIDCMPVELVNEEKKTFMKQMNMPTLKGADGLPVLPMPNVQGLSYATDLIDQTTSYLEKSTHYILFIVFLALMVFLIFSVKKMFNASVDDVEEDIMPLLKEIQKKTGN